MKQSLKAMCVLQYWPVLYFLHRLMPPLLKEVLWRQQN